MFPGPSIQPNINTIVEFTVDIDFFFFFEEWARAGEPRVITPNCGPLGSCMAPLQI